MSENRNTETDRSFINFLNGTKGGNLTLPHEFPETLNVDALSGENDEKQES